jgi:hypothetical protein
VDKNCRTAVNLTRRHRGRRIYRLAWAGLRPILGRAIGAELMPLWDRVSGVLFGGEAIFATSCGTAFSP